MTEGSARKSCLILVLYSAAEIVAVNFFVDEEEIDAIAHWANYISSDIIGNRDDGRDQLFKD